MTGPTQDLKLTPAAANLVETTGVAPEIAHALQKLVHAVSGSSNQLLSAAAAVLPQVRDALPKPAAPSFTAAQFYAGVGAVDNDF